MSFLIILEDDFYLFFWSFVMNLIKMFLAVVAVFAISISAIFAQSYTIDTNQAL